MLRKKKTVYQKYPFAASLAKDMREKRKRKKLDNEYSAKKIISFKFIVFFAVFRYYRLRYI